jgi:putative hydrolase of HD superfamily
LEIQGVIEFCELLLQFREVDRNIQLPRREQDENDAEHSYMLAMTAWYIASKVTASLNVNLVVKYALAHDLIETYAGDTYIYDTERTADKHEREKLATEILRRNYPDFDELHELIGRYEQQADAEARFVYALDKIVPVIMVYIGEGNSWHRDSVTLAMLRAHKDDKVKVSPEVAALWGQLMDLLQGRPELFPKTAAPSRA